MQKEINIRINKAWKKLWSLKEVVKKPHIPPKDNNTVFNSCILTKKRAKVSVRL